MADGSHQYDVVLDIGGNRPLSRLRRALAPDGTLVIVGGEGGGRWIGGFDRQLRAVALSRFVRQRLTMATSRERGGDLAELVRLIEAGRLSPVVGATFPLDEVPEAMRHLEAGRARGKIAITL